MFIPHINGSDDLWRGGNVIEDAEGREFTYDAENKQVEVENGSSQLIGQYYFDGDGKRVKKVVPNGETTIFVYDAIGRLIGEYSTEVQPTQDAKTQYLTADHLGTPRINTNGVGSVVSRSDYMPYGEEITTGRSSGQGYVVDDVRQGFTGYENDDETGLEYAQARMYANGHGRFSGADPYNIVLESKAEADPQKARAKLLSYLVKTQQWNRYAYVINNPLAYVDPSGEVLELTGTDEEKEAAYKRIEELCGEKCKGRLYREITRDGRTLVKYFDNKGGLAGNAGQIGKVLEEIIDSSTLVEFQVTKKSVVATADGTTENLNLRGGGVTSVFSDKIQIFMSSTAGADFSFHAIRKDFKAADGTVLTGENSVSDAHEIGHAWGAIKDKFMERYNKLSWYQSASNLYKENDSRSLQVENWQRERLGLKYRNKH